MGTNSQSTVEILLNARNNAQQAFAEFSRQITDITTNVLQSAQASQTASSAQKDSTQAVKDNTAAQKDLAGAVKEQAAAHDSLRDVLGPFISKYIEARTIYDLARTAYADYTQFLQSSVAAYAEAEQAEVRLEAALKATFDTTPSLIGVYKDWATQIEQTTTVNHVAAQQAEITFATIGNVGPAMMQKALQAASDYSAGTGRSFDSAAMIIAKAAEGNVSALQRYGIQIDKAALQTEGMGVVFDAIEEKFQGQSDAITHTLLGSWDQLTNRWTAAKEKLGGELAPALSGGMQVLGSFIKVIEESPGAFAGFIVSSSALAASMAWMGLVDLYGAQFARFGAVLAGPLNTSLTLTSVNAGVASGSILGLSAAETTLQTTTVPVTGSLLGLSTAETTVAATSGAAATSTLSLASAAGLLQIALPVAAVATLSYLFGEWLGKITGLTDGIQHWAGAAGEAALKTQQAGAAQDAINKAVSMGAPATINYAEALKYLNDWHEHVFGSTSANIEKSKQFEQQVEALEQQVLKAGSGAEAMNEAFQRLGDQGLTYTRTAVDALFPKVKKLIEEGEPVDDDIRAWYDWAAGIERSTTEHKKATQAAEQFQKAVEAAKASIEGHSKAELAQVDAVDQLIKSGITDEDVKKRVLDLITKLEEKGISLTQRIYAWDEANRALLDSTNRSATAMDRYNAIVATVDATGESFSGIAGAMANDVAGVGIALPVERFGEFHSALLGVNDDGGTLYSETLPAIDGALEDLGVDTDYVAQQTKGLRAALEDLRSPSLIIGSLTESLQATPNILVQAFTGGGGIGGAVQAIGTKFGADLGKSILGKPGEGGLADSLTSNLGDSLGGLVGSMIPAVGSLIGPLLGKLFSLGGPSAAELAGRQTEGQFEQSMGGWQGIQQALLKAGLTADEANAKIQALWASEKQGGDAVKAQIDSINATIKTEADGFNNVLSAGKNLGEYMPKSIQDQITALITMKGVTDDEKTSLQGMLDGNKPTFDQLVQIGQKYGLTLQDLGKQFQQGGLEETAKGIYNDFSELADSGADVGAVLNHMQKPIQDLIDQSAKFGLAIPDNMQPMIQKMVDAGLLTDDTGKKIKDLTGITFESTPLDKGMSDLTDAIKQLVQLFSHDLPTSIGNLANIHAPAIDIPVNYRVSGENPDVLPPQAEGGDYYVTKPTWALFGEKPGGEYASFSGAGKAPRSVAGGGSGGGVTANDLHAAVARAVQPLQDLFQRHFETLPLQLAHAMRGVR